MRYLLIQHDGKLENCSFRGTLYIKKKATRKKLPQKNHKHGSWTKDFNKNTDTSNNTGTPYAIISCHLPKANSVWFEDPYDHINPMDNNHEDTHIIYTQEK